MCAQSEPGMGPSYKCGQPSSVFGFTVSQAASNFHGLVLLLTAEVYSNDPEQLEKCDRPSDRCFG